MNVDWPRPRRRTGIHGAVMVVRTGFDGYQALGSVGSAPVSATS